MKVRAGDPGEGLGVAETLIWIETHGGWSFLVKDLGATHCPLRVTVFFVDLPRPDTLCPGAGAQ